jgi:hypothetical protein
VLITGPQASGHIRFELNTVLARLRSLLNSQDIRDAASSQEETRALSLLLQHLRAAWSASVGVQPSDVEIRQFLSLFRIDVVDADPDGALQHEAKDLLANSVLLRAEDSESVWRIIVSACAQFSQQRSGAGRSDFQKLILNTGIDIRAVNSFQSDIERLQQYSVSTFDLLSHLSQIHLGDRLIKIQRASTAELRSVAAEGSVVVVGQPGAGKSGALHDLVGEFRRDAIDYVFLAVDRLEISSIQQIRSVLGLEHELANVLANWPGRNPAFLIIDALDAARTEPAGRAFRDLIRQVAKLDRWHIVASIRKFDLRYSNECRQLFSGTASTNFRDVEFPDVRHVNVPTLTDEELAQIEPQSGELYALAKGLPKELREILFNLRLLAELLGAGVNRELFTPIRTQLDLLDLYWSYRVIRQDSLAANRESVLLCICQEMVRTRVLFANMLPIASKFPGDTSIHDLLSEGVLAEWQPTHATESNRYVLTFSHHVLFDYAISRLCFRVDPSDLIGLFIADPELTLMVRPSLVFHFRYLWTSDSGDEWHRRFWKLILGMVNTESIPEIGKLIGPSVATELARSITDFEFLCDAIESADLESRTAAEKTVRHVVGAIMMSLPNVPLAGATAGPWCELAERLSRVLSVPMAYVIKMLLPSLCEQPEQFTQNQRHAAGLAARRLLTFAWKDSTQDSSLQLFALQCVCRTYESDLDSSRILIRASLDPDHLREAGYEEMPWLARETERLIDVDPAIIEEVYHAVFSYVEESTEKTNMGASRILPLTSNRKQDYDMALYELAGLFPKYLERFPDRAVHVLITAINSWVMDQYSSSSDESESSFTFGELTARIKPDRSYIWDESDTPYHDDALKMLGVFHSYIENLASHPDSEEQRKEIVNVLVQSNYLAVIWRRLLQIGARFPDTFGKDILPLSLAIPVFVCLDTSTAVGDYLKSIFPKMNAEERRRVEEALLSIHQFEENQGLAELVRNRLLGCLEYDDLITDEARNIITQLRSANAIPLNDPPVKFKVRTGTYTEEQFLADRGVPINEEPNRRIRQLEIRPTEFAQKHLNSIPNREEAIEIYPEVQALQTALICADSEGVHPKQRDHAMGVLAEACSRLARMDEISPEETLGRFVRQVLLEMSEHPVPLPEPSHDERFDQFPSWGGQEPRIEAAEGLIVLVRHQAFADQQIRHAIDKLASDPVPSVRYHIAQNLQTLSVTAPEMMWQQIERISGQEISRGVLQGFLSGPLYRLAGIYPDRIADLIAIILNRITEGPGAKEVRRSAYAILTGLGVWRGNEKGQRIVMDLATDPIKDTDAVNHILHQIQGALITGPTTPTDPEEDAIRQRAFELVSTILRAARRHFDIIQKQLENQSFALWPKSEQEKIQSLAVIISNVGRELYFASGAFRDKKAEKQNLESPSEQIARFYSEAGPLLDSLSDVGLPELTHHLLETLEFLIPLDPIGIFLRVGKVVLGGKKCGYEYESLAVDLMVRLIQRYLADHREIFRENAECRRSLMETLDIFVNVGWPKARRLTYRLEEIFR